jgi:hypothetical protein
MLGNDLFAVRLELARDLGPGIVGFDERAAGVAEQAAARRVAQQPDRRVGEFVRCVGGEEMASRFEREAFRADTGRHDGLRHRKRFENLDPRAAAGAERYHVDRPFADRRPHIVERPGDGDSRARGEVAHARARISADDRE